MKKCLGVAAACAFALATISGPAVADQGGSPNESADCHAQQLRFFATGPGFDSGNPAQKAVMMGLSVQEYQDLLKTCRLEP